MGWFEWYGESRNPGGVGHFDLHEPEDRALHAVPILVKFGLVMALFVAVMLAALLIPEQAEPLRAVQVAAAFFFYAVVGTTIRPSPDMSNLGMMGGLIDHPFRVSDDWNRTLLFVKIALLPGRMIGLAVIDVWRLLSADTDGDGE